MKLVYQLINTLFLFLCMNTVQAASMILTIEEGPSSGFAIFGLVPNFTLTASLVGHEGIRIGEAQPASGTHAGPPDGSESPSIDQPWYVSLGTGMTMTTSPVTIVDRTADTLSLDFSGWSQIWTFGDTEMFIPLGGDALNYPDENGIAVAHCDLDCAAGDHYQLQYRVHVAEGHPFSGIEYYYYLDGYIQVVPVPAAFWLLSSGTVALLGLTMFKRRSMLQDSFP